MIEPKEIVNMVASMAFFIYLYHIYKNSPDKTLPQTWFWGLMLITVSNIATVIEGFIWGNFFNFIEHSSFTAACLFFFIGALHIKPSSNIE
jgi:hypothetical protein